MGKASGIRNLMDMGGLIVSSLLVGRLLTTETQHPIVAVGVIALVLVVGTSITLLGVRERPSTATGKPFSLGVGVWFKTLRTDLLSQRDFAWLIVARLLFLVGVYGAQTFIQYYIRDVLVVEDPIQLTGDLLAAIALALTAFSVAGGWLGDRFGHRLISNIASLIGGLGCILMLWARTPGTLLIFGGIFGLGIGLFLTANWAIANQLAPTDQAGKFMGLTNLATAGAAALSRLQGPLIDVLNNAASGSWLGYTYLFLMGAVCVMLSALVLRKVSV
jgi:Na+/melibiose symporter-like transporter